MKKKSIQGSILGTILNIMVFLAIFSLIGGWQTKGQDRYFRVFIAALILTIIGVVVIMSALKTIKNEVLTGLLLINGSTVFPTLTVTIGVVMIGKILQLTKMYAIICGAGFFFVLLFIIGLAIGFILVAEVYHWFELEESWVTNSYFYKSFLMLCIIPILASL